MRLLAWRGLHEKGQDTPDGTGESRPMQVNPLMARQEAGEIDPGLDPATLQLVLLGAIAAPVIFPDAARGLFGVEPTRREFEIRYREGLAGLIGALAGPRSSASHPSAATTPKGRRSMVTPAD
jgi:TetR/AcrR family transcriptional regulator